MSQRNYCTLCDAEVYLSDDHKVIDGGTYRQIVIDGVVGEPPVYVLKKIDSRASAAEIQILYKEPETPGEPPVVEAPVPEFDFDSLMGGTQ